MAAPINSEQSLGPCLHQWLHRPANTILGSRRIFSGFIRVSGDGTRIIPRAAMAFLSHGCIRLWRTLLVMVKGMRGVGRSRLGPLYRDGWRQSTGQLPPNFSAAGELVSESRGGEDLQGDSLRVGPI